eukprot:CAMPEP_0182453802 /NCGR_PEP_ID=MMETSP1319-20130603/707_1 /TAXON_ID=172717 /ORGANISM="Bolidomonas pacifica, Strain RCC208" /LENGTH=75 /DNA_ID=CAMNT_0024651757 /DNA_START=406 /DNA_END=630 /DNA_ORIENTATION=-
MVKETTPLMSTKASSGGSSNPNFYFLNKGSNSTDESTNPLPQGTTAAHFSPRPLQKARSGHGRDRMSSFSSRQPP